MDGLTNIIAKINEQNEAECLAVVEAAKSKADAILSNARADAEKLMLDIKEKTKARADIINSKAVSSSELEYKRAILQKKSSVIDDVISKVIDRIANVDDETYFGYIETLIKSNAVTGSGTVKMSAKDVKRLPSGFEAKINSLLGEAMKVSFSDDTIQTAGGFVIEYPELRIDCTFESIVDDKNDEIRDEINKILFA